MNLAFLKAGAVAVASGGCSARSSAQRELVTSGLYTTLADSTNLVVSMIPLSPNRRQQPRAYPGFDCSRARLGVRAPALIELKWLTT